MAEGRGNLPTGVGQHMFGDITDTYGGQVVRQMPNPTASFDGPSSGNILRTAPPVLTNLLQISSPVGSSCSATAHAPFLTPLNDSSNISHVSGGFVPPVIHVTPQRTYSQHMADERDNLPTGVDRGMFGVVTGTYGGQVVRQMPNSRASFDGPSGGNILRTAPPVVTNFMQLSSPVGSLDGRLDSSPFRMPLNDSANISHASGGFVPPVVTPQRTYPQHTVGISQPPVTFPLLGLSELQGHMPESGSTEVIKRLGFSPVSGSAQNIWLQSSQLTESGAPTETNNRLQEREAKDQDRNTGHNYDPSDHDVNASSNSYNKDQDGMSGRSHGATDVDSCASSDSSEDIECCSWRCYRKVNVVCLDCCERLAPKFCRKHSKDRHPGKLADIHHRITVRSQVTSQRVSYTQDDSDHNRSHKFSNRRYVCNMIKYRESCEGEATVACLDCSLFRLELKCSTCDMSAHTGSKANHRRIRLHPVSTDDVREGSSTAAGSDGDGECSDSTSRMEEDGGESYDICQRCSDEAVEACMDCDVCWCNTLCSDCDIKRHIKKLTATHCRIPVERFKPLKHGQKDVEILTETFDVPYDKFYVCRNQSGELNLCEGKATYVVLNIIWGGRFILLCNYCCKEQVKYLEDNRVIMLHYQDSVPNVEHENISLQQNSDETNLENNTNETTPQIAMEHQIRTTDTQRNTNEATESDTNDHNSDNSIVREDLDTTTQVSSQHESRTVAPGNHEERDQNSSDGDDFDHAEGSHYKCDRCDRPAHSVCLDCDRNDQRLCRQCYKTKHKTPASRRHLMPKIPHEPTPTRTKPVTLRNLRLVHDRYLKVFEYTRKQKSVSLTDALKATGIKRQTLIDRHGIAELRIVDKQKYSDLEKKAKESFFGSKFTVKDLELKCREELQKRSKEVLKMKSVGKLLPFDIHAYKTQ